MNVQIASSLNDAADAHASLEQHPHDLRKHSEFCEMHKKSLGWHNPDVANVVCNMAKMHESRNNLEPAKNRFAQGSNVHVRNEHINDALWNFSRALECALSLRATSNDKSLTPSTITTMMMSNNINDEKYC